MKVVKYIISVVVILFCFTLGSELYQSHLQTFSNQFYFIDIESKDREAVYDAIVSATDKFNEEVFAIERKDIDTYHSEIVVYATEKMKDNLIAQQNIVECDASSVFSGETKILYRPFDEVISNYGVIRYYFTGSKDVVSSIRQYINSFVATSYIHKEAVNGNESLVYFVWALSFGFILLMTWLDIQYSRKSDFLKLSMGSSATTIVVKNILADVLVNFFTALVVYLILKNKIFVGYKLDFALVVFLIFNIINSCLYISLFRSNYKEIIYGANINGKLLANTYLLKAMTMIMLVISLTCNFTALFENADGLKPYDTIDKLTDYSTISVTPNDETKSDIESVEKLKSRMFMEAYLQNKVMLSTSCAALEDPIIVLNDVALENVVSSSEQFKSNSDAMFVVYIPENKSDIISDYDIEFAVQTTATNFFGLPEYSFDLEYYSHADVVYFDLRTVSELPFGFEMLSDPLVVMCNVDDDIINELIKGTTYVEFEDRWANIIFSTDMFDFSDEITKNVKEISHNGVVEQCSQHKASLLRTVLINSTLSIFLLVLSILLISVIVKMEYLINSKEIALKKILGYSILHRNTSMIMLNVFSIFISFITGLILSNMYDIFSSTTLCLVCLLVFVIDTILILCNMAVAENKNTAHILKGGSL